MDDPYYKQVRNGPRPRPSSGFGPASDGFRMKTKGRTFLALSPEQIEWANKLGK